MKRNFVRFTSSLRESLKLHHRRWFFQPLVELFILKINLFVNEHEGPNSHVTPKIIEFGPDYIATFWITGSMNHVYLHTDRECNFKIRLEKMKHDEGERVEETFTIWSIFCSNKEDTLQVKWKGEILLVAILDTTIQATRGIKGEIVTKGIYELFCWHQSYPQMTFSSSSNVV